MNILLNIHQSTGIDGISLVMSLFIFIAFAIGWAVNRISLLRIRRKSERSKDLLTIMQHTLNSSRNYVLRMSIPDRMAYNLKGDMLPEEGLSYEEGLKYIHPDDVESYHQHLQAILKGARRSECTIRWDWSRDKHLGEWRYLRDIAIGDYTNPALKIPTSIFCTFIDQTEQVLQQQEEEELTDRYRKIFEQSLIGLAFYDKEGHLMGANQKMREILKFQSEHDPYYYSHTLFEMPTFRDIMFGEKIEPIYFCTKSMLIERGVNCYTELRVRPIYDDEGELVFITFSIRDITQERELYLQNKNTDAVIRRTNEAIQQYETELQYLMDHANMRFFRTSFEKQEVTFYKGMSMPESQMDFDKLIAHFIDDDFAKGLRDPYNFFKEPKSTLTHMHPFFHEGEALQWNFIDSVPYYDESGRLAGTYGIVRNVTDLINKQERLKEETERANESGRRKSTFMANMTHEIRTPLNAIVGFSDVLPMLSTPEEKKEIIRVITNNCDMLLRLVNDILAVSALDNGGIEIKAMQTDFAKDFNDVATTLAQRVQAPGVEFIADNPYSSYVTTFDSGRVQQVITNFVTNAVKYTQQGHIKIGYHQQERHGADGIYLYCEDTGSGIPKEAQTKVFERFVKLNDYIQGTGLGLSICKAIADSCKGEIGVFSDGVGKGSTFWFWLPCERKES